MEKKMREAASNLDFEQAARLRDEVKRLRAVELAVLDDPMATQRDVEDRAGRYEGERRTGWVPGEDGKPVAGSGGQGSRRKKTNPRDKDRARDALSASELFNTGENSDAPEDWAAAVDNNSGIDKGGIGNATSQTQTGLREHNSNKSLREPDLSTSKSAPSHAVHTVGDASQPKTPSASLLSGRAPETSHERKFGERGLATKAAKLMEEQRPHQRGRPSDGGTSGTDGKFAPLAAHLSRPHKPTLDEMGPHAERPLPGAKTVAPATRAEHGNVQGWQNHRRCRGRRGRTTRKTQASGEVGTAGKLGPMFESLNKLGYEIAVLSHSQAILSIDFPSAVEEITGASEHFQQNRSHFC